MGEKIFIRKRRDGSTTWLWSVTWGAPCYDNDSEEFWRDERNDAWRTFEEALKYAIDNT